MFSEQLAPQLLYSTLLPDKKNNSKLKNLLLITAVEESEQKLQYLDLNSWVQLISYLIIACVLEEKKKSIETTISKKSVNVKIHYNNKV